MTGDRYRYDGWDIIENSHWRSLPIDVDQADDTTLELGDDLISNALLVEMQRPPWWRDLDKQRKALAEERA